MTMTEAEYHKLPRHQKLAVFLIIIGPDAAAEVLRHFDENVVELVCREVSGLSMIPGDVQRAATEEFAGLIASGAASALGGIGYAQRALEIAKGDHKAHAIIGRLAPAGSAVEVIREISEMEGRQIFNLVKNEQPQTISFLLSYLESAKAAEVFALLGPELREEVVERLGTIESTSLELVSKIARSLGKHCDGKTRSALHHSGGVRAVAELLNQLDKDTSKNLLTRLEERNGALGAAIRRKLFSFEDLSGIAAADLQRILREVEPASLAIAMKSASEGLKQKIYAAVSKRAAESLKDEVELLGPVRLKQVEAAQDAVIQVIRRLEEEGQITLEAEEQTVA